MSSLTTEQLSRACRTFLKLAYPGGEQTIPPKKRAFLNIPADAPLASLLPPAPAALGVCQVIKGEGGAPRGYAFRLGSSAFPHLKLQVTEQKGRGLWVFAVDTHDAFPRVGNVPPESHPDFPVWTALQKGNRQLKEAIERAWEEEGLCTFTQLIRLDLDTPGPLGPADGPGRE